MPHGFCVPDPRVGLAGQFGHGAQWGAAVSMSVRTASPERAFDFQGGLPHSWQGGAGHWGRPPLRPHRPLRGPPRCPRDTMAGVRDCDTTAGARDLGPESQGELRKSDSCTSATLYVRFRNKSHSWAHNLGKRISLHHLKGHLSKNVLLRTTVSSNNRILYLYFALPLEKHYSQTTL